MNLFVGISNVSSAYRVFSGSNSFLLWTPCISSVIDSTVNCIQISEKWQAREISKTRYYSHRVKCQ